MKRFLLLVLLLIPSLSIAQTTNFASRNGQTVVAFSATPAFDAGKSNAFKITLTANVTSSTLIGAEAGQWITLEICQDGTGSRTFVPPVSWQGFVTITSGANTCTEEAGHYDGTNIVTPPSSGGGGSGTVNNATVNQIAKYPGTGTTVGGSAVFTDDGTSLTYTGTGGVVTPKVSTNGAGAGAFIPAEGAVPSCTDATKDILAADSISHSLQICNHGTSTYQSAATNFSTSPTLHGVSVGAGFPAFATIPTGSFGQPLISCGTTCDPGFGNLDAAGGFVNNRFPKTNLLTTVVYTDQLNTYTTGLQDFSAVTFKAPITAGAAPTTNGLFQYDSTSNNYHGGLNGADSRFVNFTTTPANNDCPKWVVVGGNVLLGTTGGACGAGGSSRWDQITAATAGATTDNADNAIVYRSASTTAGRISWRRTESAASTSTGTPFLEQIDTLAGSTANPFQACAGGTANCWRVDTAALFKPIGAAAVAIPGTTHGVVVSQGAAAGTTTVATGTAGQVLISNGASTDASFQDPIVSKNYTTLWTAQDVTTTRTSSTIRISPLSANGSLLLTWASITGSPSGCTIQIKNADSAGNLVSNGSAVSVSPANGTSSQAFLAAAGLQTSDQMQAVFACSVYPSTGTLTLDFVPGETVYIANSPSLGASSAVIGHVIADSGSTTAVTGNVAITVADGANTTLGAKADAKSTATDTTAITIMQVLKEISAMEQAPASRAVTNAGTFAVQATLQAGSALAGEIAPVATATTTDSLSEAAIVSAASTNSTSVKGSAGNLYGYEVFNTTTTVYYLRLYNTASAPTCSSATGFIRSIPIPPANAAGGEGGAASNFGFPVGYSTGIGYCITGGSGSTDTSNAAVGVFGALRYK